MKLSYYVPCIVLAAVIDEQDSALLGNDSPLYEVVHFTPKTFSCFRKYILLVVAWHDYI